jgi:hypothetical protein
LIHGVVATSAFVALILFAIARSKRLSDFLETISDETLSVGSKWQAFWLVLKGPKN